VAPAADVDASEIEQMKRLMAAEEASLKGGFFRARHHVLRRWLRRALQHPVWLGGLCVILIAVSIFCFNALA